MRRTCLVLGLAAVWLVGLTFSAYGFAPLLEDRVSISGYVQNQSSYRIGEDEHLVSSENRLQLRMGLKFVPNVRLYGIFRGIYDAVYDLRSGSDRWDTDYAGSRDKLDREHKMRELFTDVSLGRCDFRIGKQQVVWGETDGLRLMDIINPLDMRRQYITRDWEDIRIPQTMVKATYQIDPMRNAFLEFLWNPGDLERDKIYADTTMSDADKSPWTLSNSSALEAIQPLRAAGLVAMDEEDSSEIHLRNSEFGVRLGGEIGGWFLTLNYWQGFSKSPVPEANLIPLEPMLLGAGPPPALPILFRSEYPREKVIGFTFNKATGLWVWRGEFATYLNKHYNITETGLFLPNIMIAERTQQASMLGFDYKRFITWLNPEKMFFFSGQLFHYHIFSYDDELRTGPFGQDPREDSFALSFLVNTGYDMERICPEILVVYDPSNTGYYIKSRIEFKYGNHWRPEIGALVFGGDQYELPFGDFDNKDEIYFRLKYQF